MIAAVARQELFERPLSRYQYSNLGIALLGEIVARVSGIPYERYVRGNILDPLGLRSTSTRIPDEQRGKTLAVGHGSRKRDGTRDVLPAFDPRGLQAAAGFSSNVEDLTKMVQWQLRVLKSGNEEVLRPWSLREMQRVQWTDPDGKATWGLGFGVSRTGNDVFVGHGGWCPGYRTVITMIPEKEIGAVVALSSMEDPGPIARTVLALAQKVPTKPPEKSQNPVPDLAQYIGTFSFQPWSAETRILAWGSDLAALTLPSSNPAEDLVVLRPVGTDAFRGVRPDKTLGAVYTFLRDDAGRVKSLRVWAATAPSTP
jgi:CubicO group peptidase (beta-lactamase class C family)